MPIRMFGDARVHHTHEAVDAPEKSLVVLHGLTGTPLPAPTIGNGSGQVKLPDDRQQRHGEGEALATPPEAIREEIDRSGGPGGGARRREATQIFAGSGCRPPEGPRSTQAPMSSPAAVVLAARARTL